MRSAQNDWKGLRERDNASCAGKRQDWRMDRCGRPTTRPMLGRLVGRVESYWQRMGVMGRPVV